MTPSSRLMGWRSGAGALEWAEPTPRLAAALLALVMLVAVLLRLHGLPHDLPYSFFTDEMVFVNRAMVMGTGDLNPRWFNKPAFLMYLLLVAYSAYFAVGWLLGQFASPEAFGVYFIAGTGPFVLIGRLIVLVFGVAAVYATYLVARRAFGSVAGALSAALVAAVLLPMVVGSYLIKADVPAGLFIALSVWAYLQTREDPGLRPVLLAGAFAGLSMGTKYYGVVVLPVFGLAELARPFTAGTPWSRVILRGALLCLAFLAAFFVVAPYNFLDPTFATRVFSRLASFFAADARTLYDPDSGIEYDAGLGTVPDALAFTVLQLLKWDALTWPLAVLVGLGMVRMLARRETRWAACMVAGPAVMFLLAAASFGAYHADSRHLNAIYALLAVFVFPGALLVARGLGLRNGAAVAAATALVLMATAPAAYLTVKENVRRLRPDSRAVAAEWIAANLPRGAPIVLDDYGPDLPPGPQAVARERQRLERLRVTYDTGGAFAFTEPEARRLAMLEAHPIAAGFNVERLGHYWWLPRELSEQELLSSPSQWHASNPLVNRVPSTPEEYRAAGFRYIITSSIAECRYQGPNAAESFPSSVRFYRELRQLEPLKVFDPTRWDGKGPVIYVYDLERLDDPTATGVARGAPDCDVGRGAYGTWPGEHARNDLGDNGGALSASLGRAASSA